MVENKDYCDKDLSATLIEMGFKGFGPFYYDKGGSKLKTTYQFLTPRTAKALNLTLAISLYEAQKWLRKDKQIEVNATWDNEKSYWFWYINEMTDIDYYNSIVLKSTYNSYEKALLEGIKEAVKILKEK